MKGKIFLDKIKNGKLVFYDFDEDDEEDDDETAEYSESDLDPHAGEKMRNDILIGIFIAAVPFAVTGILWSGESLMFLAGLLAGTLIASGIVFNMYKTLLNACEYDEEHATSYIRKSAIKRMFFMGAALIAGGMFVTTAFVFGMLLGMLCLKFSAYIQPLTNKYVSKKFIRKGR